MGVFVLRIPPVGVAEASKPRNHSLYDVWRNKIKKGGGWKRWTARGVCYLN